MKGPDARPRGGGDALPGPAAALAAALTAFYRAHRRDLPWRRTADPYAIWVSEVMLQQTQVATVLRYFPAFLARFPTVGALAGAAEQDVLSVWSGLGYYRRARLMHRAARQVRDVHGGRFPRAAEDLRALPGVGEYTAGALRSIAFGQPAAAVDGNVTRVLARLCGLPGAAGERALHRAVTAAAQALVEAAAPAQVTQGLMELGATVCTPAAPRCGACPWAESCRARSKGVQAAVPAPKVRPARREVHAALALVLDQGRLALVRRGGEGLFAGLWQMPGTGELPPPRTAARAEASLRRALQREVPGLHAGRLLSRTQRVLTHRQLHLWVFEGRFGRKPAHVRLVPADDLGAAPLSAAMRAALRDALHARGAA